MDELASHVDKTQLLVEHQGESSYKYFYPPGHPYVKEKMDYDKRKNKNQVLDIYSEFYPESNLEFMNNNKSLGYFGAQSHSALLKKKESCELL